MREAARSITLSVATLATALLASRAATAITINEFPLPTAGQLPSDLHHDRTRRQRLVHRI